MYRLIMRDPLRAAIGRSVVAHVGGVSVRGRAIRVSGRAVVLEDAVVFDEHGGASPTADGVFVVDRPAMFQVEPAELGVPRLAGGIAAGQEATA